ncbi:hypothetical protein [Subtercola sp. YIM 133946]|uniref:hypothetical protein n=1 Tax=Subtercola sp. YIM 133946 TaxID=3118909 RepID=UPI002F930797
MGNTDEHENSAEFQASDARARRPVMLVLLGILLLAEAAVVLAVGVWQIGQLPTIASDSLPTGIALLVLVLAAGLWVLAIAVGVFRMRPWTRGAALTWQVLQIIVAICCFQNIFASPDDGWPLLIAGLLGIGLVLSPSVVAATRREL